jgi:hypothetical protein
MILVMAAILLTSPLATALETALLAASKVNPDRFMFELGAAFGPRSLQLAIVSPRRRCCWARPTPPSSAATTSSWPWCRLGFLPTGCRGAACASTRPHRAIVISVLAPGAGDRRLPGPDRRAGPYLLVRPLGAFTLTSLGLDKVKWQERARDAKFYFGTLITAAWWWAPGPSTWSTSGWPRCWAAPVTLVGCAFAFAIKRGKLIIGTRGFLSPEAAEHAGGKLGSAIEILTVEEAIDMREMYRSSTLVALRSPTRACSRRPPPRPRRRREGGLPDLRRRDPRAVLPAQHRPLARGARGAGAWRWSSSARRHGGHPHLAHGPRRRRLAGRRRPPPGGGDRLVGTSQRSAVWHLLRGNVLESLIRDLPRRAAIWICN